MEGITKARYVLMSLVANKTERRCAQKVIEGVATQEEVGALELIYANIVDRERGRTLVIPSDPELAQSLLSGLEAFVSSVRQELLRIEGSVIKRRNLMISLSLAVPLSFAALLFLLNSDNHSYYSRERRERMCH